MASSISGQATLKHHAFSSLPNCVQRVAPWNILFTYCGVDQRKVGQCALILAIEGLFVNGLHGYGQTEVERSAAL